MSTGVIQCGMSNLKSSISPMSCTSSGAYVGALYVEVRAAGLKIDAALRQAKNQVDALWLEGM